MTGLTMCSLFCVQTGTRHVSVITLDWTEFMLNHCLEWDKGGYNTVDTLVNQSINQSIIYFKSGLSRKSTARST